MIQIDTFHDLMEGGEVSVEYLYELFDEYAEWLDGSTGAVNHRVVWSQNHDMIRGSVYQSFSAWVNNNKYDSWFTFVRGIGNDVIRDSLEDYYNESDYFKDVVDRNTYVVNERNAVEGTYKDFKDDDEDEDGEPIEMSQYGKLHEVGIVDDDMSINRSKLRGTVLKFIKDVDKIKGTEEELNRDDIRAAYNRWMLERIGEDWSKFISDKLDPGDLMDVVLYVYKNSDEFKELAQEKFEYDPSELEGNSPLEERRRRKKKQSLSNYDQDEVNQGRVKDDSNDEGEEEHEEKETGEGDVEEHGEADEDKPDFDIRTNEVYNASCVDVADSMDDNFLDALITDPPYGQNYDSRGEEHDVIEADDNLEDALGITEEIAKKARMKLKRGSPVIMFAGDSNLCGVKRIVDKWFDYKQTIIWDKDWIGTSAIGGTPVRFRKKHEYIVIGVYGDARIENENRHDGTILKFQRPSGDNRVHPTEKPLELMRYILDSFTQEGDLVFDPFSGSGATLVAAKQNDRDYIGTELDEDFYSAINDRLGQNTISDWT